MKKVFIGTCVTNPFKDEELICSIVNNANQITVDEFTESCHLESLSEEIQSQPDKFKCYKNGKIMFFNHEGIEYFYK